MTRASIAKHRAQAPRFALPGPGAAPIIAGMDAPFDARLQYWLSQFWTFFRQNDRAIECLRAALKLAPDMLEAWQYIGFLYSQRGDQAEALHALGEAVRLAPDDPDTRFNLGFIMHQRGDDDGAIAQYTEVVRMRPSLDRAWYGLGAIFHARRDWPRAIANLQEAAKLQYFNPYAGHLLATAYHFAGQQDKALEEWKRVQGFDPKAGAQIAREIGAVA